MSIGQNRDKPALLRVGDVQRLARAQKFYDRRPRNSQLKQRRWPVGGGGGGGDKLAKAPGGGIASGTESSPTSGTVTLYVADPSTAALSATGDTTTAYNILGTSITANKTVIITNYYGFWYIIGTVC